MSNKLKCACFAAFCSAWLCSTVALAEPGTDYFSSGSTNRKSSRSVQKVRTAFSAPPTISESSIMVRGDIFAGFEPRILTNDLEQYLGCEPRDSDPFACWLMRGKDPSTYLVGQPKITYITESSPTDAWAEFFAGKGPRPFKLSPEDAVAQVVAEAYDPTRSDEPRPDEDAEGPFSSGATASGSDAFASGATNWRNQWGGDRFSSGLSRSKRGYRRTYFGSGPAKYSRGGPKPAPFVATKPMSGRSGVLPAPRWPNLDVPLRVYISGTVAAARGGLVSHEIKSALREWREASNGKLRYVLTQQYVAADIVFVCEQTTNERWAENVTEFHNCNFDRVRVCLLEETLLRLEPKRVRGLCLHEVGHAFGIQKHSDDKRDAMSLSATDDFHPVLGLSNNDRKLIANLYP